MKNIFISLLLIIILTNGCTDSEDGKRINISRAEFKGLVLSAINGNAAANDSLSGLVDLTLPVNNNVNAIIVEEVKNRSNKKFYYLLLEFPNPVYNRFAVYDTVLNNYIIDKSLNGRLFAGKLNAGNKLFIRLNEKFKSKNVFEINRLSLYEINDTSVNLLFREIVKFSTSENEYNQKIVELTKDRIKTDITSRSNSEIDDKSDIFIYEHGLNKYISTQEVFYKFLKNKIKVYTEQQDSFQITDRESALRSTGIDTIDRSKNQVTNNPPADEINGTAKINMQLTGEWKEIKNISIVDHLNKKFTGNKYINDLLGANISLVKIPANDSAESFIKYDLVSSAKGKFEVRYSGKIEDGKSFVQFYEFSCRNTKYLIIFSTSKYTYDRYKHIYDKIIDSFSLDC